MKPNLLTKLFTQTCRLLPLFLLHVGCCLFAVSVSAATYTFSASEDAEVNSTNPSANFGISTYLTAYNGWASGAKLPFLKFNISAIPDHYQIVSARLFVYCHLNYGENDMDVVNVENDSWQENAITYANMPEYGYTLDSTTPVPGHWLEWDLLRYSNLYGNEFYLLWNWSQDLRDNVVSLMIFDYAPTGSGSVFYSREYNGGTYAPYLVIEARLLGDCDGSGSITLKDAILALEILGGKTPSVSVNLDADVDGSGKIDMAEAIYVLQKVAGLR